MCVERIICKSLKRARNLVNYMSRAFTPEVAVFTEQANYRLYTLGFGERRACWCILFLTPPFVTESCFCRSDKSEFFLLAILFGDRASLNIVPELEKWYHLPAEKHLERHFFFFLSLFCFPLDPVFDVGGRMPLIFRFFCLRKWWE